MALHHALSSLATAGPVTGVGVGPAGASPVAASSAAPPVRIEDPEGLGDRVRAIRVESS